MCRTTLMFHLIPTIMKKILFGMMLFMGSVAMVSCKDKVDKALDEMEDMKEQVMKLEEKKDDPEALKEMKEISMKAVGKLIELKGMEAEMSDKQKARLEKLMED